MSSALYNDLNTFLRSRFGCRVQKISIDAGLTCPNRDGTKGVGGCLYCNRLGSGTGAAERQSISEQIESARAFLARRYGAQKYIAYFQSYTNTYAPLDKLERLYREALSSPDIVGLAIGTRPDCVDDSVLDLLTTFANETYLSVEYGLQSIHDKTLDAINRRHRLADFLDALRRTRLRKIDVCAHVILGLPGETREDMLETARTLGRLDIQSIKIHLLYITRDSALNRLHEEGSYQCLDRASYIETLCGFLALLPPRIVIQRLTGDPHPAELVEPRWALEKQKNLRMIREALIEKKLWQGKNFEPNA